MHSDSDNQSESQDASSLVEAHCILYVIHSKTDLRNKPPSLEAMAKIKKSRNEEGMLIEMSCINIFKILK